MKNLAFNYSECRKSFGMKVFNTFTAVVIIVSAVFTFMNIRHEITEISERLTGKGELLTSMLANSARTGVFAENRALLEDPAGVIIALEEVMAVSIFNSEGKPLLSVSKKNPRPANENGGADKDLNVMKDLSDRSSVRVTEGAKTIELMRPIILEAFKNPEEALYFDSKGLEKTDKVIGYVSVTMDKSGKEKAVRSILIKNTLVALMFLLSGLFVVYVAVKWITDPLSRLTEAVRRLGLGEPGESVPIESSDEIGKLAIAFNDMAANLRAREQEKEKLEEELRHAQKMEAIGVLARGVAHDFNNIMATILGAAYLMRKKMGPDHPFKDSVDSIHRSVARAKNLVKGLVAFSRGEAIFPMTIDLCDSVSRVKPVLEGYVGEKVAVEVSCPEDPVLVKGDPVQLEQVMVNLVTNARDAMPDGGKVTITVGMTSVGIEGSNGTGYPAMQPGKYALVSVSDTGEGIDEEIRDRIFEPFFTTKEVDKGTGLGLSIIYGIVSQHRGQMDFYSEKGTGTVFRIFLPLFERNEETGGKLV